MKTKLITRLEGQVSELNHKYEVAEQEFETEINARQ